MSDRTQPLFLNAGGAHQHARGSGSRQPVGSLARGKASPTGAKMAAASSHAPDSDDEASDCSDESHSSLGSALSGLTVDAPALPSFLSASPAHYACVMCDRVDSNPHALLGHLLSQHSIVIRAPEEVADLTLYLKWWTARLHGSSLEAAGATRTTLPAPAATPSSSGLTVPAADGWLLGAEKLADDATYRAELQRSRLDRLIALQHAERMDTSFRSKCLFCKKVFEGDRALLFQHMFSVHKFNIGLPDNIVHVAEFLALLESKIEALMCVYCEKHFKSYSVLKLHMRKKKHFRIDVRNHQYDRFYLVNYLEAGKDWKAIQDQVDDEEAFASHSYGGASAITGDSASSVTGAGDDVALADGDDDWVDGGDDGDDACVCLFCEQQAPTSAACYAHMATAHKFDWATERVRLELDFYGSIKVINFVRRQVFEKRCPRCALAFPAHPELLAHMTAEAHCALPDDKEQWQDAQYFFPTYENDALLHSFQNDWEEGDDDSETGEAHAHRPEHAHFGWDEDAVPAESLQQPQLAPEYQAQLLSLFQQQPELIARLQAEPTLIHELLRDPSTVAAEASAPVDGPPAAAVAAATVAP